MAIQHIFGLVASVINTTPDNTGMPGTAQLAKLTGWPRIVCESVALYSKSTRKALLVLCASGRSRAAAKPCGLLGM